VSGAFLVLCAPALFLSGSDASLIADAAVMMRALLNDLVDLSRIEAGMTGWVEKPVNARDLYAALFGQAPAFSPHSTGDLA
jgi:hypothetical protein